MIAVSLTITAFEWRFYDDGNRFVFEGEDPEPETIIEIPITKIPPPEPPKAPPVIEEVSDDTEIEVDLKDLALDVEIFDDTPIPDFKFEKTEEEEAPAAPFETFVEENASFTGGQKAYAKFLKKNLKYPNQARRMGIEGKVFVRFIIEKDGRITEVEAVKGIGFGCDQEAVRVISMSPQWNPGKQRGRPVRQQMIIPIYFRLD